MKKELIKFIIVGTSAVICDFIVYFLLLEITTYSVSKTISFICGATLAYFFNKYWTFNKADGRQNERLLFMALYLSTLLINVTINKTGLWIFGTTTASIALSFLAATGASTILNFIGQKWVVFK